MPQSDEVAADGPRRVPTADDFPRTGPFSLAAPGPRFGARAVDLTIVCAPVLAVLLATAHYVSGQVHFDAPIWLVPSMLVFGVLYDFITVAVFQRSLGKLICGLRVVRYADGRRPTAVQSLLRAAVPWSVLALPFGPFAFGLVLVVFATGATGPLHRGVPDRAGGTLVISTR